jgi:AraC-like DNA-binding protein
MRPIPLVRRVVFQHCSSTFERLGFNAKKIQERSGIPVWQYGNPDDLVPYHHVLQILDLGAKTIGDSSFGLIASEHNSMKLGTFGKVIARSASVYDACRNSVRLIKQLNSSANYWLSNVPGGVLFCRNSPSGWQMEQYVLGQMVGLVQMSHDFNWRPSYAYLSASQRNDLNGTRLFKNTKFYVGHAFTAIFIPNFVLSATIDSVPHSIRSPLEKNLRKNPVELDLAGSVSKIVESMLPHGNAGIETICEIIGISKRTLQRELAKENVIFRELVGRSRYKMACELLVESRLTLIEIAHEIGYASDTQFVRAFVNLAGVTPSVFRNQHCLK